MPELTALHSCVGLGTPLVWFVDAKVSAPESKFTTPAFSSGCLKVERRIERYTEGASLRAAIAKGS